MSNVQASDVDISGVELRKRANSTTSEDMKVVPANNVVAEAKLVDSGGSFDSKVVPQLTSKEITPVSDGKASIDTSTLQSTKITKADSVGKIMSFDSDMKPRMKARKSLIDPSMDVTQLGPKKDRRGSNVSELEIHR